MDRHSLGATLKALWLSEGVQPNEELKQSILSEFEAQWGVQIPVDLGDYLLTVNGLPPTELHGLARLWSLQEYRRVIDVFELHKSYAPTVKQGWALGERVDEPSPLSEGWHRLRSNEPYPRFLLPDAASFYLFGDYNIEGSHWAINLGKDVEGKNAVVSIYEYTNRFHYVATSFSDFLTKYITDGPEGLI